jgi:hypothetical protein
MPLVPSVKGSVLVGVVEEVNKLLAQNTISRQEMTRWLTPEDIALLNQEIRVSEWYDVRALTHMSELLRDVNGKGDNEYLRWLGRRSARRLLDSGLYQQLEYLRDMQLLKASDSRTRSEAFGRDLRLLATISGSIYNFTKIEPMPDPDHEGRYLIRVSEARDYPDVLAWRADGFMNEMATEHDDPNLWSWERTAPDVVLFRMNRSL